MIRTIQAISKGPLVERLTGILRVVSVYGSVVNLVTEEGLLLSLVKNEELMSGFAVLVPDLFNNEMNELRRKIKVEILGILSDEVLRLLLEDKEVLINLESVRTWDHRVSTLKYSFNDLKVLVSNLDTFLLVHGKKGGFLDVNENHFLYHAKKVLKRKITTLSPEHTIDLSDLIGLGIGFTPSGDDFVTGCLLAEELADRFNRENSNNKKIELLSIDREMIKASLKRTNDGGRSLLYQALEGIYPAYILAFVHSIHLAQQSEDKKMIEDAVKEMVLHGETSGTDTLTGFVWYFNHLFFL